MRSFIDAFAHQQLDDMRQLSRDFGRRPRSREKVADEPKRSTKRTYAGRMWRLMRGALRPRVG